MYTKDKTHRITLRLNDDQFQFIAKDCEMLGVSPSDYLRMVINSTMALTKQTEANLKGGFRRENDKANFDH